MTIEAEFIFDHAPFPAAHASTIVESEGGLVAAWFAGKREGHGDVGIWLSRREQSHWTYPVEVVDGRVDFRRRYPCWNPVLFQPGRGPLLLFYKVGPSPSRWWGMMLSSPDGGRTWSEPHRLPRGILGPIKNKPVELASGRILCPSSDEEGRWRIHVEWSDQTAERWDRGPPLNDGREFAAIQPTALVHPDGRLQLLSRTRQGTIAVCWSTDAGETWSPLEATDLPNPDSGIDAVSLADGRHLLVYNHTQMGRSPLNIAISRDGVAWEAVVALESEPGEFSYPAVIQAADGTMHVTYTWNRRRIRHVSLAPDDLTARSIEHGVWPDS